MTKEKGPVYQVKFKKIKKVDAIMYAIEIMSLIANHPHVETVAFTWKDTKNTRQETGNTQ